MTPDKKNDSAKRRNGNATAPNTLPANGNDSAAPANADQPWYHTGLRFRCTGCGGCCTGAPGYVWVVQEEIDLMAEALKITPEAFEEQYVRRIGRRRSLIEVEHYDCVFFDRKKRGCKLYEARPRQCRTWPFWESNLTDPDRWRDVCGVCPGSGKGRLVLLDEIENQKAVVRV